MTSAVHRGQILVLLGVDDTEQILARVYPIAGPQRRDDGPAFALATIAEADGPALEAALRAGTAGVVLRGGLPVDVERLAGRLAVAEAAAGLADGVTSILLMIDGPVSASAAASIGHPSPRLTGVGIDTGALADHFGCDRVPPFGAALTVARGLTVLAAAAAGVPAFEAIAGPATSQALAASRADGFAWAMLPDHRIAAV